MTVLSVCLVELFHGGGTFEFMDGLCSSSSDLFDEPNDLDQDNLMIQIKNMLMDLCQKLIAS